MKYYALIGLLRMQSRYVIVEYILAPIRRPGFELRSAPVILA